MPELIKNTYELANRTVPVVSRRKYETDPYGFTIKDIVTDSEKMLEHQMYNIEQTTRLDSDWVPFLEPWHGVGIYADAFGSKTSWPEDDYPWTEPCIEDISQVYKLKPDLAGESPLMEKVLTTIELFQDRTDGRIPIALTDTQSPMNTASLVVRTEELLMSCYTHPEAVHHLLDLITDLIIDFSKMQLGQIGENKAIPGHLFPAGGSRGISVSDDNCSMVSPDMYRRFFVPYFNRISRAFGGIYIHSCGDFSQNLDPMLEIEGLLGVNMHIGPGDMDPTVAAGKLGGKCLLWADVGMKWQEQQPTLPEFFTEYYLPGLLGGGEVRGVIVEAPPVENMDRRKELVVWTREKVSALIGEQSGLKRVANG